MATWTRAVRHRRRRCSRSASRSSSTAADRCWQAAGGLGVRALRRSPAAGCCGPSRSCRSCCPPSSSASAFLALLGPAQPAQRPCDAAVRRRRAAGPPRRLGRGHRHRARLLQRRGRRAPRRRHCGRTSTRGSRRRRGMLGASPWRAFREVTWPLLRPAVLSAASIVLLFTVTSFGVVLLLGGPRDTTLEVEIYRQTAILLDLPTAAALTLILQMGRRARPARGQARAQERARRQQRLRAVRRDRAAAPDAAGSGCVVGTSSWALLVAFLRAAARGARRALARRPGRLRPRRVRSAARRGPADAPARRARSRPSPIRSSSRVATTVIAGGARAAVPALAVGLPARLAARARSTRS